MAGFVKIVFAVYVCCFVLFDRSGVNWIFHVAQLAILALGVMASVHGFRLNRPQKTYLTGYLGLMAVGLLSSTYSVDSNLTILKCLTMLQIFVAMICSSIIISRYNIGVNWLILPIIFCLIINLGLFFTDNDIQRFQGTCDNPNYLAGFASFGLFAVLLFWDNRKWTYLSLILALIITGFIVVVTASKKGVFLWLILAGYGCRQIWSNSKIRFIAFAAIAIFVFTYLQLDSLYDTEQGLGRRISEFASGEGTSTKQREQFLTEGFRAFLLNPFLGSGLDSLRKLFGTYSHSNAIEILGGTGLLGAIAYSPVYISFWQLRKRHKNHRILLTLWVLILFFLEFTQVTYYYKWSVLSGFLTITFLERENSNSSACERPQRNQGT